MKVGIFLAQSSLNEAVGLAQESNININEAVMNKFNKDMLNSHTIELKKIDDTFKNLNLIIKESKEFEEIELITRREVSL